MSVVASQSRDRLLKAARHYARLAGEHRALEARLGQVDDQLRDAYTALRDLAPAAFGDCADTTAWEELFAAVGRGAGDPDILTAIRLPRPLDGAQPPSREASADERN